MPLPTRHVVPSNVARKYPPRKHDQEYIEFFYQLPSSAHHASKTPSRYSSVDGANHGDGAPKAYDNAKDNVDLVSCREEGANRILANMIRQIASLSLHAHEIFGT